MPEEIIIPVEAELDIDGQLMAYELDVDAIDVNYELALDSVINVEYVPSDPYTGAYVVDPSAHEAIILETKDKTCTDDITVNKIKTSSTTNPYGTTFYIAEVS